MRYLAVLLRVRTHLILCACLLALHVCLQLVMHYPTVLYDELVYLGMARFFAAAGPMPNLYAGAWGHLGYSGVISPAFWLFRDFPHQYHTVLIINALLMTSTYPLLYVVLKRITIRPSRWLAPISFAVSVYPSFLLFSDFAVSENLFTPLFLLVLLLYARYLERPIWSRALWLGIAVVTAYAVHSRGLSIIICLIGFCVVLGYRKRVPWPSAAMLSGIGILGIILIGQLKHLVESHGPPTLFPRADLSPMLTESGLGLFGLVLLGQLVYLSSTTINLYLSGLFYLAFGLRRPTVEVQLQPPSTPVRRNLTAFVLATHACVFFGSAVFVSGLDPLSRPDHLLMGRYNEPLIPVIMGAGLLLMTEAGEWAAFKRLALAGMAACIARFGHRDGAARPLHQLGLDERSHAPRQLLLISASLSRHQCG